MIARRTFLKWGTAAPLILARPLGGSAAGATAQNTLVVLDGLDPSTDHARTAIVLDAFARKGLPVTCLVDPEPFSDPGTELLAVLGSRLKRAPGLIQVVPLVGETRKHDPVFSGTRGL
ncbi:MAG: hypothetical protein ABJP08_10760 [Roseibium sp.]